MTALAVACLMSHPTADMTYFDACRLAKAGKGQPTWRFILAVGVPPGDPTTFYACPVYALTDPPVGTKPGYYQVVLNEDGKPAWLTPTGGWQVMPVPKAKR